MTTIKGLFSPIFQEPSLPNEGRQPLTAMAALVQAREAASRRRVFAHVSWLPDVIRIRGSIIPKIIGPVLTVTTFAVFVASATYFLDWDLKLSNGVVPLLSVVVGLLLVFRNGSAYERYSEGRKDFTALLSASRNLSRLVWIQVTLPAQSPDDAGSKAVGKGKSSSAKMGSSGKRMMTREELRKQKVRFLRLTTAFVLAVKHHLRGEPGTDYEDFDGVLPSDFTRFDEIGANHTLPNPTTTSPALPSLPIATSTTTFPSAEPSTDTVNDIEAQRLSPSSKSLDPKRPTRFTGARAKMNFGKGGKAGKGTSSQGIEIQKEEDDERTALLKKRRSLNGTEVFYRPYESQGQPSLPLPLVIIHDLSRMIYRFKKDGTLELAGPAGVNAMQSLIQTMVDQLGAMERVVRTPLPPLFGIHLKQSVSLYLFSLPLVLVDDMGWLMIAVVSLVAFTLMGVEGIAAEVENPFGDEANDLPLDLETAELRVEVEYIINRLPEGQDDDDVFAV